MSKKAIAEITLYQCVVCGVFKEAVEGQKVDIYLKETVGSKDGFICPDCSKKRK